MINCKNGNLELENQIDEDNNLEEKSSLKGNLLSGFIERDSATGKIEITGFLLSIIGLSNDHEQKINFNLDEWRLILNIFKYYNEPLKIMIRNYKSSPEEIISK
jgi:hypothetical protein